MSLLLPVRKILKPKGRARLGGGRVNNGLAFTPRNQTDRPNVSLGYQSALNWERTQAWTVVCYIKISQAPDSGKASIIFTTCNEGSAGPAFAGRELFVNDQGKLNGRVISNFSLDSWMGASGGTNVCDGVWHKVAMTDAGSSASPGLLIYVDGVLETMTSEHNTLTTSILNTHSFLIGNQAGFAYSLGGSIKELSLSNVARSGASIAAYTTAAAAKDANTSVALPFDENTGYVANDISGNGFHGALHGTTWPGGSVGTYPAPAPVQGKISSDPGGSSLNSLSVTLDAPVGNGNAICGYVVFGGTGTVTVTDDKGNTYTTIKDVTLGSIVAATFYLSNITNAPTVITVTKDGGGTGTFWRVVADEFANVQAAQPLDVNVLHYTNSASGTDGASSGSASTLYAGDLVWAVGASFGAVALSAGTGFTLLRSGPGSEPLWTEYKVLAAAGNAAATFTPASTSNVHVGMLALKAK